MKTIKIKIPATTANFGSGYDVLGAALKLYNEIEVTRSVMLSDSETSQRGSSSRYSGTQNDSLNVKIEIIGEGKETLPKDERNIVYQAMKKVFDRCKKQDTGCRIKLTNRIPLARGMGSSAAARIGGLVAANKICGNKLSNDEIIKIATELEGHPDNVVPALRGGLCVSVVDKDDIKSVKYISMPNELKAVLCIPDFEVSTDKARKILPKTIPHRDAVFNSSRVALFLSAISQKKYELLSVAMDDRLHQPYRKKLIPGLDDVFSSAKKEGAYGVCISGSGPTVLALSSQRLADRIGKAMQREFSKHRVKSRYFVSDFDNEGIKF